MLYTTYKQRNVTCTVINSFSSLTQDLSHRNYPPEVFLVFTFISSQLYKFYTRQWYPGRFLLVQIIKATANTVIIVLIDDIY